MAKDRNRLKELILFGSLQLHQETPSITVVDTPLIRHIRLTARYWIIYFTNNACTAVDSKMSLSKIGKNCEKSQLRPISACREDELIQSGGDWIKIKKRKCTFCDILTDALSKYIRYVDGYVLSPDIEPRHGWRSTEGIIEETPIKIDDTVSSE